VSRFADSVRRLLVDFDRLGIHLDSREIAEALWLAVRQSSAPAVRSIDSTSAPSNSDTSSLATQTIGTKVPPPTVISIPAETADLAARATEEARPGVPALSPGTTTYDASSVARQRAARVDSGGPGINRTISSRKRAGLTSGPMHGLPDALPISIPASSALPAGRGLALALRPLKRRVRSKTKRVIDEAATVYTAAEERRLRVVEEPTKEKWLNVAIIEDIGPSMALWCNLIDEFARLLSSTGFFSDITRWSFRAAGGGEPISLYRGRRAVRPHDPRELVDPSRRRLVLIISDSVSEGWRDGTVAEFIAPWAKLGIVSLIQMLPPTLWRRTGLVTARSVWLRPDPTMHNRLTGLTIVESVFDPECGETSSVPVLNLDERWVGNWSRLVASRAGVIGRGLVMRLRDDIKFGSGTLPNNLPVSLGSAEEVMRAFRTSASPKARRLASYCAAVPLTLPIMRLVQDAMIPGGNQAELAEVLLSGLVVKASAPPSDCDGINYDFLPGVREVLLSSVSNSDVLYLLTRVSDFVSQRIKHPINFRAWLLEPGCITVGSFESAPTQIRLFAEISATTLRRLGGKYALIADRLDQASDRTLDVDGVVRLEPSEDEEIKARNRRKESDESLDKLNNRLRIVEQLGDRRQTALALRDIARIKRDRGENDEAITLLEEARRTLNELKLSREHAITLRDIAELRYALGLTDEALGLLVEARRSFEQLKLSRELIHTLGNIAEIERDRGGLEGAVALHWERLRSYEQLGDRRGRAIVLGDIARIEWDLGNIDRALAMHQERLRTFEELGDARQRAFALADIARMERTRGNVDQALALHRERLGVFEKLGDSRQRAFALADIATIELDRGNVDGAGILHQERLHIFEIIDDPREQAFALADIGRIECDRGNIEEGLVTLHEQLHIFVKLGEPRGRAWALADIARVECDRGNVDQALAMHQERLGIFEKLGEPRQRALALADIARIERERGNVDQALAMHQERLRTFEEIGQPRQRAFALADIARIESARGNVDQALAMHTERLDLFEKLDEPRERGSAWLDIAWIRVDRGEIDAALKTFEDALQAFNRSQFSKGRAWALGGLAHINRDLGRIERALEMHQERMNTFDMLGRARDRAATMLNIAWIKRDRGEIDQAANMFESAFRIFDQLKIARERAWALNGVAAIARDRGDVDQALAMHRDRLQVFEALGDTQERSKAQMDVAVILRERGAVDQALVLFEEVHATFKRLAFPRDIANTVTEVARTRLRRGDVDQALELFEKARSIFDDLKYPRGRGALLTEIARIGVARGEIDRAFAIHQERLRECVLLGFPRDRAVVLADIGRIKHSWGEFDEALSIHQERLGIFEGLGEVRERGFALTDIARIKRDQGELWEALRMFEEALRIAEQLRYPQQRGFVVLDIAKIKSDWRKFDEAMMLCREALKIFDGLDMPQGRAVALECIARIKVALGEIDEAKNILEEAFSIIDKIGAASSRADLLGVMADLELRNGAIGRAKYLQAERLEIYRGLKRPKGEADALKGAAAVELAANRKSSATELLADAYKLAERIGWLKGMCEIDQMMGDLLVSVGNRDEALSRFSRSEAGLRRMGLNIEAHSVRSAIEAPIDQNSEAALEPDDHAAVKAPQSIQKDIRPKTPLVERRERTKPTKPSSDIGWSIFEVHIAAIDQRTWRVIARTSQETAEVFVEDVFAELGEELISLPSTLLAHRFDHSSTSPAFGRGVSLKIREMGSRLFDILFSGHTYSLYNKAREKSERLNIQLFSDDLECFYLPWESLYDTRERRHLCCSTDITFVRGVKLSGDAMPREISFEKSPLRILVMESAPQQNRLGNNAMVDQRDRSHIVDGLTILEREGKVHLGRTVSGTVGELSRSLRRGSWDVFHFNGPGGIDEKTGESFVVAQEEGNTRILYAGDLSTILTGPHGPQLVVLATSGGGDAFSIANARSFVHTARRLICGYVPTAITMQWPVSDQATVAFSRLFYSYLLDGYGIRTALTLTRVELRNVGLDEWIAPVLYMAG
jgi:tetratricopeptide (TPR) repeat protein